MKPVKLPHPKNKRFEHVCHILRLVYPEEWGGLIGVTANGHWTFRSPSLEFEIFHCPFCGRDLNEVYNTWAGAGLWEK